MSEEADSITKCLSFSCYVIWPECHQEVLNELGILSANISTVTATLSLDEPVSQFNWLNHSRSLFPFISILLMKSIEIKEKISWRGSCTRCFHSQTRLLKNFMVPMHIYISSSVWVKTSFNYQAPTNSKYSFHQS